jgi:sec-independent protein translocase protein TatA
MNLYLFLNLGPTEIILIFAAILLLFGGRKIPELMRGIGKGIREFNSAKTSVKSEIEAGMKEPDANSGNSGNDADQAANQQSKEA